MNALRAVFLHEWKRSVTAGRVAWWCVMAVFPAVLTAMIRSIPDFERHIRYTDRDAFWSPILYVLIPCVCSALSVLLTAAPAVAAELEQRTWVYLATRPNGIFWLLIGKYLVAATWGFTAAIAGTTGALFLSNATSVTQIWSAMSALSFLSCTSYAALFLLIGVISPKRAMVFSVMYTGFVEVVLGFIPAMINRLTIQYRLRSLLVQWAPLENDAVRKSALTDFIGEEAAWLHCLWLFGLTTVFLTLTLLIAHRREFTSASEGDV